MPKVTTQHNLSAANPKLAQEWHPSKNGKFTPCDVAPMSHRKVRWQCEKGHEWSATVKNRSKGTGCPYCGGQKVCNDNCLAIKHPKLAKEWHSSKNGTLTPEDVTPGSDKKVWWCCKKGHEWPAIVGDRSRGKGCPYCNSQTSMMELRIYTELKFIFPDTRLREKINGIESDIYIPSLKVGVEYDGVYWHRNKHGKDTIKNAALKKGGIRLIRVREVGLDKISEDDIVYDYKKNNEKQLTDRVLKKIIEQEALTGFYQEKIKQYLNGKRVANNEEFIQLLDRLPSPLPGTSLVDKNPALAKTWHPTRNGSLTPHDVTPRSNKKVWWVCQSHEWQSAVSNRFQGKGCPYCSGRLVSKEASLAIKNPTLAGEWHPTKNGSLLPVDVLPQSNIKVWWQCEKSHEWTALIYNRANGRGCPDCGNKRVSKDYCLAMANPSLAKEWHPTRNGKLTPKDITPRSGEKVWWQCERGHEWLATVHNRNNKKHPSSCPYCNGQRVCKENCLATQNPRLAKEWHPTKNGKITPEDVMPFSHKKVWWWCDKGHEWESLISYRNAAESRCPYCAGQRVTGETSLAARNPNLAKEWHPTKNGNLTPKNVMLGAGKKVWWQCQNGHEWQARICHRARGSGCSLCYNNHRKNRVYATKETCLARVNSVLAKEWHPTKNGELTPKDVLPFSNKKVWWKCFRGHEWATTVNHRSNGRGCPYCRGRKSGSEKYQLKLNM